MKCMGCGFRTFRVFFSSNGPVKGTVRESVDYWENGSWNISNLS